MSASLAEPRDVPAWARDHVRPGERIEWWGRPSPLGLVPISASAVATAALAITGIGADPFAESATGTAVAASILFALAGVLSKFVRDLAKISFTAYVVTDRHFYAVRSLVTTTAQSAPLSRLSGATVTQGVVGRILGYWTARIAVYGEKGTTFEIPAIRDGDRLLAEVSEGLIRGANAAWLTRGD